MKENVKAIAIGLVVGILVLNLVGPVVSGLGQVLAFEVFRLFGLI